ncbi:hypothetical protein DWY95_14400 [Faecalibacterium sp. AF28-13AC]|nr:hypothetical protein DWY95_14400 [Faecalibacterium sp. AF28-13AC]
MTLSSLRSAKCSGLFEDSPMGNVSCGRVAIRCHMAALDLQPNKLAVKDLRIPAHQLVRLFQRVILTR